MRKTAIEFTSQGLKLEGVLSLPEGLPGPLPGLLICHPHPKLGGDMDNPLVVEISNAATRRGIAALRFNFRGVGVSEGVSTDGAGEQEDMGAALNVLRRWPGIDKKRLAVAGHSFGASMVLGGLRLCKAARSFVLIAPPISSVRNSQIKRDRRPKLFLTGSRDRISPSMELQRALDAIRPPVRFVEILDADHGLGAPGEAVAEQVASFVKETV